MFNAIPRRAQWPFSIHDAAMAESLRALPLHLCEDLLQRAGLHMSGPERFMHHWAQIVMTLPQQAMLHFFGIFLSAYELFRSSPRGTVLGVRMIRLGIA
jgi:hypothetical protein